ncbi:MAG: hydrogenase expression/formation protein [Deltaproteobacteria bacterium]|nr:hydrogenase expression/formation protein [Deltaproteobacteria bacterium]
MNLPSSSPAPFPVGKLPPALLGRLLAQYAVSDPSVLVGPRIGEDAAVIDLGEQWLVAKTDPITFATDEAGYYVVHVNANDIATMGGTPRWFLATVLLPEGQTTEALVEQLFARTSAACREAGIAYCGGHTEVTAGLDRPIVVGQMLGTVPRDRLVLTSGARPGDAILLTKGIAIEATSIIARERGAELRGRFDEAFLDRCRGYLFDPGISVLREARILAAFPGTHCMHDPTEGGLAAGLWEIAQAAGVGLEVEADQVPVLPESARLCEVYGLDPWGAISSGALLATVSADEAEPALAALRAAGIRAARIGQVLAATEGLQVHRGGRVEPLPQFVRDEITRLY